MKNRLPAHLVIIAVILGSAIFKDFDFGTLTFKKPWLDAWYILIFAVLLFLLFRNGIQRKKEEENKSI